MDSIRRKMFMATLLLLCFGCGYPHHGYWGDRHIYAPGAFAELGRDTIVLPDSTGAPDLDTYIPKRLYQWRSSPVFHVPPGGGEGPVMSHEDREMMWNGKFRLAHNGHWVPYVVRVIYGITGAQTEVYLFVPGGKRPILFEARIE